VLDGRRLYQQVAARVAIAASKLNVEQIPEYSPLRFAGHEAGDFVFVPRNNARGEIGPKDGKKVGATDQAATRATAQR